MKSSRVKSSSLLYVWLIVAQTLAFYGEVCGDERGGLGAQRLVSQWQERLDAIHSIYCDVQYTTLIPAGSMQTYLDDGRPFPPKDWFYSTQNRMWLDLKALRSRLETRGELVHADLGRLVPRNETRLFDGSSFQQFTPTKDYQEQRGATVWVELQEFGKTFPHFLDHGVLAMFNACAMLPGRVPSAVPELPNSQLDPSLFHIAYADQDLAILRTRNLSHGSRASYYELWVNLTEVAISRYVGHRNGHQYKSVDYYYDEVTAAPWIPSGWTETRYRRDGSLAVVRKAHSARVELNPNLDGIEFQMTAKPGMFVQLVPERVTYYPAL